MSHDLPRPSPQSDVEEVSSNVVRVYSLSPSLVWLKGKSHTAQVGFQLLRSAVVVFSGDTDIIRAFERSRNPMMGGDVRENDVGDIIVICMLSDYTVDFCMIEIYVVAETEPDKSVLGEDVVISSTGISERKRRINKSCCSSPPGWYMS